MAQKSEESLTQQAASFLRGREDLFQSLSSTPEEISRQAELLVEWSRERGRVLENARFVDLEKYPNETMEHEVFYDRTLIRVFKRTYPGRYGLAHGPKGKKRNGTPVYYLERLLLMQEALQVTQHTSACFLPHITLDVRKIHSRNTTRLGCAAGCFVGAILTWSLVMADFYVSHPLWLTALVTVVTGFGIWGAVNVFRVR